ncbi:PREDICTED: regulator of G-protein signaling rgs-2-like [Amphimedon queenslandica]|uniref:RGS domain-containing protein n=1 Tax=Amphimedon queenslandica TaxID=400682 RepID=A0AAN0IHN4_AMPQE|nr:PREDICTED: regulator of G-protein signaling rgs-2-like [Amphimedon queenslandica]|eukprot:XP_003389670.1 PREDICTED: regulator of G-protein signaling rgs-2-like [Amphimedon queenslandica]
MLKSSAGGGGSGRRDSSSSSSPLKKKKKGRSHSFSGLGLFGISGSRGDASALEPSVPKVSPRRYLTPSSPVATRSSLITPASTSSSTGVLPLYGTMAASPVEDAQKRFPFLPRLTNRGEAGSSRAKKKSKEELSLSKVSKAKVQQWGASFDNLLSDPIGIQLFERFLQKECSDENILFWKDCQKFKFAPKEKLQSEAERIFAEYIAHNAPNLVNIDHTVRDEIVSNMSSVTEATFDRACHTIYILMQRDSYSRFVKLPEFKAALL